MSVQEAVAASRAAFNSGVTRPLAWRLQQLRAMQEMLLTHRDEFTDALAADLGKPQTEAWLTEIGFVDSEINHTIKHLEGWLQPRSVPVPLSLQPARASTVLDPLGVVLVIAPWNYPVQLLLGPMVGALAAGNTVVGKPSEMAPASSAVLERLVPQYLAGAVSIVEGGVPETTKLLEQRFDHILFTGNAKVGRIVMAAAARNLTPVTLELGGKSPVYLDESVNVVTAARRIVWAKFMNAGQTCVAPDYVLGTDAALAKLAAELPLAIADLYGPDPEQSAAYGRIIHDAAFARLTGMLAADLADDAGSALVCGGRTNAATRYLEPTVLYVDAESELMEGEIFGPILPLVTVGSAAEAIAFIKARDKPLSLYVLSEDEKVRRDFTEQTSSGALNLGVPAAHASVPGLPFGGVGESGMGAYHGRHSVEAFSHRKAMLDKALAPDTLAFIYPPFGAFKKRLIERLVAPAKKARKAIK